MTNIKQITILLNAVLLIIMLFPGSSYGNRLYILGSFASEQTVSNIHEISSTLGIEVVKIAKLKEIRRDAKHMNIAIIAPAKNINKLSRAELSSVMQKMRAGSVHLMMVYENINDGATLLTPDIKIARVNLQQGLLRYSNEHQLILQELSNVVLPVTNENETLYLKTTKPGCEKTERINWVHEKNGEEDYTLTLRRKLGKGYMYVTSSTGIQLSVKDEIFLHAPSVLPYIIFFRNAFGEYLWHRKTNQANITIDDPWLHEPYGNLSYFSLLNEMEKANFHTTIAMVPWNYDRSENAVIELFKNNKNRYSICIHGNNHGRNEFKQYEEHSLKSQEKDIQQALVRMNKFKNLTGIDYDKVMVFPRGIAPVDTIKLLSQNNFLSSANFRITPRGSKTSRSIENMLLPATITYHDFPLLKRYPPTVDKNILALMIYFRKPAMVYTHQGYLSAGIDSFNGVAQYINATSRIKMEWENIGKISESLFLEKLRPDRAYDVWMICRKIVIENETKKVKKVIISKIVPDLSKVSMLYIGNRTYESDIEKELMRPKEIMPGEQLSIELVYPSVSLDDEQEINNSTFQVKLIRAMTDFRDIYLSRMKLGRWLIDWYYRNDE